MLLIGNKLQKKDLIQYFDGWSLELYELKKVLDSVCQSEYHKTGHVKN